MIPFGRGIAGPSSSSPVLRLAAPEKPQPAPVRHHMRPGTDRCIVCGIGGLELVQRGIEGIPCPGIPQALAADFGRDAIKYATAIALQRERESDRLLEGMISRAMQREQARMQREIHENLYGGLSSNAAARPKPLTIDDVRRAAAMLPPKPPVAPIPRYTGYDISMIVRGDVD